MPPENVAPELVRHEVASLHRFIEPIVEACSNLRRDHPVYSPYSREFFDHIQTLGGETLRFLESFPSIVLNDNNPTIVSSRRQKLFSLKAGWEKLHEYVQPALDADSLHLPTPLITALHDRLHEFQPCQKYRFTLFHTVEANYFEIPSSEARETADSIADLVGGTTFPNRLGLLGIPYSQGDGLFLNCILAHEIGHFYHQELASPEVTIEIDKSLQRLTDEIGELDQQEMSFCSELLTNWTEEVFCDLFAIVLIGPAFSFAFIQLIGASFMIGQADGEPDDFFSFSSSHPGDVTRIRAQQRLLQSTGWWEAIGTWTSAPAEVLRKCAKRSELLYTDVGELPATVEQDRLIQCYDEICEWLLEYFFKLSSQITSHVSAFRQQSPTISEYLRRAVVPSSIVIDGHEIHPSTTVLLNAGFQFLLESMNLLYDNVQGVQSTSVETRSRFTRRLELWLLKALEDSRLLERQVL